MFPLQFGQAINFSSQHQGIFRSEDLSVLLRINPKIRCITGHMLRPYIDLNEMANVKYITVFRDPVSRYLSHHLYWVERQRWDHTFEHFLTRDDVFNFQTKIIAGKEDLLLAKDILKSKFHCVGILEQFEDFLILLNRRLPARQPLISNYKLQNPGKKDSILKKKILDNMENYRERIIHRNQTDIQLYEYVKNELLPAQRHEFDNSRDNQNFLLSSANSNFKQGIFYYLEKLFAAFYYVPVTRLIAKVMSRSKP
jgi:hypothetical protein